jgi:hypothetical protein
MTLYAVVCEYDSGFDERSAQLVVSRDRAREVCRTLNREIAGEVPGLWRVFRLIEEGHPGQDSLPEPTPHPGALT